MIAFTREEQYQMFKEKLDMYDLTPEEIEYFKPIWFGGESRSGES